MACDDQHTISFCGDKDKNAWLSNYQQAAFRVPYIFLEVMDLDELLEMSEVLDEENSVAFTSVEAAFHYMKQSLCVDAMRRAEVEEKLLAAATADEVKSISAKYPLTPDEALAWREFSLACMWAAMYCKFDQNPLYKAQLIAFRACRMIEDVSLDWKQQNPGKQPWRHLQEAYAQDVRFRGFDWMQPQVGVAFKGVVDAHGVKWHEEFEGVDFFYGAFVLSIENESGQETDLIHGANQVGVITNRLAELFYQRSVT